MVIETIQALHKAGKLHVKLRRRLWILTLLTLVGAGIVGYDILFRGLSWWLALLLAGVSFVFGLIMSRLNVVNWDEDQQLMVLGRIDRTGTIILVFYIIIRLLTRTALHNLYHNIITLWGLTLSILFGVALGRLVGTFLIIYRQHKRALKEGTVE